MADISFDQFEARVARCTERECPFRGPTQAAARIAASEAYFHYGEHGITPVDEGEFRQKVDSLNLGPCLAEAGIVLEEAPEAEEMGQLIQFPTRRQ